MLFAQLLRSFDPVENPIGFGPADFLELGLAIFLAGLALAWRPLLEPFAERLAKRTRRCMVALAILPIALRLALIPNHPVPPPSSFREFSNLLVADTLRYFRLTNAPHPLHRFFETLSVLQEPSYSSIYPIGQGLALLIGRTIFGNPWAGVVLTTGALCALCYWMLRGWTTPAWALAGGGLAVIQFGPLCAWMNSYWSGSLAAAGGCLVFGSIPRLKEKARPREAALLGFGIALELLTLPGETILVALSVALFFLPSLRGDVRALAKPALIVFVVIAPAAALMLVQNKQATGSWTTTPSRLSQIEYGVPGSLTFEASPAPQHVLTPQQELAYRAQMSYRAPGGETLRSYLLRLEYRVRYYRFFFLAPLYLALPFFFMAVPDYRFAWAAVTILIFSLGTNFIPEFDFGELAPVTCLFVLVSVTGLERLSRLGGSGGRDAAWVILALCAAHFIFWYSLHAFETSGISQAMLPYETWNSINHPILDRRSPVNRELARAPGKQLVFVRYSPQHIFTDEWVYNDADIGRARVVWARDLGPEENQNLLRYYPDRTAWLLEPDVRPPRLSPYSPKQE